MPKLHNKILSQAAAQPESVALEYPAGQIILTYRQLHEEAVQLSAAIKAQQWPTGSLIALFLPKSPKAIVAILATLLADMAYLPLDIDAPDSRNGYILKQSGARAVLMLEEKPPPFLPNDQKTVVSEVGVSIGWLPPPHQRHELPENLAYVLYTSGSTGLPKGVMVAHDSAWAFADWAQKTFSLAPDDVLTAIAPLHFDLSIFDIFAGLSAGASLVMLTPQESKNPLLLSSYLERYGVTTLYATPTLLKLMPRFGKADRYDHSALRQVLFAGEVFPIPALRALQTIWPSASFYNLYGPTETNVCTWHPIPQMGEDTRQSPYPIGQACPYDQCAILKDDGSIELELSSNGELIVAGTSVMAGYLGAPEQTRAAFVEYNDQYWYKTGDLVEVDANGDLLYRGRRGRMVKRRGYRIELGEIEVALHQHEEIEQVACLAQEQAQTVKAILAYYTTTDGALPHTQLTAFLAKRLPDYMIPDRFVYLQELPQTSSQKIDYQALKRIL